jgi:alpha-galactosidase
MPGILQRALWLLLVAVAAQRLHALSNGVGRTPAMGWNSWNFFRCNINETVIKEVADAIVASGLRDAGYKYVNIGGEIMGYI